MHEYFLIQRQQSEDYCSDHVAVIIIISSYIYNEGDDEPCALHFMWYFFSVHIDSGLKL